MHGRGHSLHENQLSDARAYGGRMVCFASTANREFSQTVWSTLPLDVRHSSVRVFVEGAGSSATQCLLFNLGWNAGLWWRSGRRRAGLTGGYRCLPMVHETMRQNGKSPLISQLTTRGTLAEGYRELMRRPMVVGILAASVVVACAVALVGPIGFYHRENPLQRMAQALFYTVLCWPVFYGQIVIVYYFLRLRRPLEILGVLVGSMVLASFQGSAVVHTVESLTYTGYEAQSGFVRVFLLFSVVSVSNSILYFYLVWQRVSARTAAAARPDSGGRATEEARSGHDLADTAAESPGGDSTGRPFADSNGTSRAVLVTGDSGHVHGRAVRPAAEPVGAATGGEHVAPGPRQVVPYRPDSSKPLQVFKLLPDGLGTDLVFIKSEDHYLEVHTTAGSSLIKMRFSDAIAELGDRGLKVHRSYWVATSHVTRSVRAGKRTVLRLTGDHRVPVSVTHLRAVRAVLAR